MDHRISHIAALANAAHYDAAAGQTYVDGAPHIKHASLRKLYGKLVVQVFDRASRRTDVPRVLDLGAGEGTVTLPFLELGARVTAVDVSRAQLTRLRAKCRRFGNLLDARCLDIHAALRGGVGQHDIVVLNSVVHHIPDYLGLIRDCLGVLSSDGQFFSFQDPLRYDTLSMAAATFSKMAYLSWRVFKGDVMGGIGRRLRRARGVYLADSVHDNAEYHVVREGVDHEAICELLETHSCDYEIVQYFSTQSRLLQPVGAALRLENTFAILAHRRGSR